MPAAPGDDYWIVLDGTPLPDPCSRWQPEGCAAPSRVLDPGGFEWTDARWPGVSLDELVLYELHVGTFTPEGTFDAVIPHLRELRELGITAIELMPVAEFPGDARLGLRRRLHLRRVLGLRRPARPAAARRRGARARARRRARRRLQPLGVSGVKALEAFGPYFTDKYETFWGKAINYDDEFCDPVREWVLAERRGLGARLPRRRPAARRDPRDPRRERTPHPAPSWRARVHAVDAARARDRRERPQRPAGDPAGRARRLRARRRVGRRLPPRAARAADRRPRRATTRTSAPSRELAKAFGRPFVHDGGYSAFRRRRFGAPADDCPPEQFVVFCQNHDQVGNRALGDRLPRGGARRWRPSARCCPPSRRCCSWARSTASGRPSSSSPTTSTLRSREATREGRRREFARFAAFAGDEVPDPQDRARPSSARSSRDGRDARLAGLYRDLLADAATLPSRRRRGRLRRGGAAGCACGAGSGSCCATSRARRRSLPCVARGDRVRDRRGAAGGGRRPARAARGGAGSVSKVWPGRPFPLGATWDGTGTNFSLFSEHAERVELCLFDDEDRETRIELSERTAYNWHCYLPGVGPGQRYGYRVHGPYDPAHGHRFNPTKLLIDPYAKAIEGAIRWEEANVLPYVPDDAPDADLEPDDEDDAEAIPKCVVVDQGFDWEGDQRPSTPWSETIIYETHVRGFTKRHPDVREDLRGTYAGLASEPAIEYLTALGVTARRAAADPPHRRRELPARPRAHQLLGLQLDRLPRAARALRRHRHARRAGARVQGHGQGAAPRGHRGDPRRRLQPHRGGQPPRADALLQGHRQRELLPPDARRPALLHGLHGHGQLAQPSPPERAAPDHGLAALLGDRVPRRRLPLRPRRRPGARVLRRRPAVLVLRRDPPGPGALPGEADRRAVGRRTGRLPGRQLPAAVDGVERHLPRRDARLLARPRAGERVRLAVDRLERSVLRRRTAAVRLDQLRHLSRRLHARRPRQLRAQAQRGQRRGQPRRQRRQPQLELRRRGPDRRPRGARAARAPAAQLPGDPVPLARRADAARRRRARPHPARQQQRLVPGQRDLLVRLGARRGVRAPARVHEAADRAAPQAPGLPQPALLRRQRRPIRAAGRLVVSPRRAQDDPARLGPARPPLDRPVPERARDLLPRRPRRGDPRRLVPAALQRGAGGHDLQAARASLRRALGARALDRGPRT